MDSLLDGRSEGNFRKVTKEYEDLLLEIVDKEPSEYGYEFGRWTSKAQTFGLELVPITQDNPNTSSSQTLAT